MSSRLSSGHTTGLSSQAHSRDGLASFWSGIGGNSEIAGGRGRRVWLWMTGPNAAIQDPGQRRQARLLSVILLVLIAAVVLLGPVAHIFLDAGSASKLRITVVAIEGLVFLYLLSRSRYYAMAAALTVVSTSIGTFALLIPEGTPDASLSIYLVVPVLLSSMLLSTLATFVLTAAQIVGMTVFCLHFNLDYRDNWLGFVLTVSMLVMLAAHHWAGVEQARRAAVGSERNMLRTIIDHIPDCVYVKDTQNQLVLQNRSVTQRHAANGETGSCQQTPSRLARERAAVQSGTILMNHEEMIPDASGRPEWWQASVVPLRDSSGEIIGVVGIERNVTAGKQAATAMARYTHRLSTLHALDQSILAGLPAEDLSRMALQAIGLLVPCSCGTIVAFDRQAGTTQTLATWYHPDRQPVSGKQPAWMHTLSADVTSQTEPQIISDLGRLPNPMPLHTDLLAEGIQSWCSVPLFIEEGLIGLLCLGANVPGAFNDEHLDIAGEIAGQTSIALRQTHLRQRIQDYTAHLEKFVEQRTAEIEQVTERVEAILNNTSDAIILAYTDGTIIQTNAMFDQLFGYSPDALFHQPLATIIHSVDHARFQDLLAEVIENGQVKQIEITACRPDQSTFFAEIGMSLVASKKHPRGSIVCSLHDVTERKLAEEDLRRTLEKERELGELRTYFISMTSHEFRTPLATITSSAELLTHYFDRMGAEQRNSHLERITTAIHSMSLLLEDTMLFGRAEAGRLEAKCSLVDFSQLCQDVLEDTRAKTTFLKPDFIQSGTSTQVYTDENLVRRILTNLLSNAVKYSPDGTPVQLELTYEGEQVTLRVIDQGIGIPPQDQARLGDPFHRAQNVGTIPGNGLGFAITRQAVALLKGTIDLQSEVGKGTTVTVTLPTDQRPNAPQLSEEAEMQ